MKILLYSGAGIVLLMVIWGGVRHGSPIAKGLGSLLTVAMIVGLVGYVGYLCLAYWYWQGGIPGG